MSLKTWQDVTFLSFLIVQNHVLSLVLITSFPGVFFSFFFFFCLGFVVVVAFFLSFLDFLSSFATF